MGTQRLGGGLYISTKLAQEVTQRRATAYAGDVDNLLRLIRWFLFSTPRRRRIAMYCWDGDWQAAVHDVYLRMATSKRPRRYRLSTLVGHAVKWAASQALALRRRRRELQHTAEQRYAEQHREVQYPLDVLDDADDRELILKTLKRLRPRECAAIEMSFGLIDGHCCTLKEIGRVFGVSDARAGQILNKGLRALQHPTYSRPIYRMWLQNRGVIP